MDSRIEELATIILERAKSSADLIKDGGLRDKDRYHTYRRFERLAVDMLTAIHEYRVDHRDEYVDRVAP